MTRILLDVRHDIPGGTEATTATLIARRTRIRVDGSVVTYPTELRFAIPGVVDLVPPASSEGWALELYSPDAKCPIYRTVVFSGSSIDWADLTDIDPILFEPIPVTSTLQDLIAAIPVAYDGGLNY